MQRFIQKLSQQIKRDPSKYLTYSNLGNVNHFISITSSVLHNTFTPLDVSYLFHRVVCGCPLNCHSRDYEFQLPIYIYIEHVAS
jgi:hypothetical protein